MNKLVAMVNDDGHCSAWLRETNIVAEQSLPSTDFVTWLLGLISATLDGPNHGQQGDIGILKSGTIGDDFDSVGFADGK